MRLKSLATLKKGWFDYENDPDHARFEIGVLTPGESREVDGATSKLLFSGGGQEVTLDHTKAATMRAVRALKRWENVFEDANGNKALPCNDANKLKLLNSIPGFEAWVLEKLTELNAKIEDEAAENEKNS